MKKIISSKLLPLLHFIFAIFFFTISILSLTGELLGLFEDKGAGIMWFIILLCFSALLVWDVNRMACIVCIQDGIIKRKGLFCGYYKECPVDSIRSVVTKSIWREGNFIYLVDDSAHEFNSTRKNSYIRFLNTKKNVEFLRSFWSGTIENVPF